MMISQITETQERLKHKAENFATRCDRLEETITEITQQKIKQIEKMEKEVKDEVEMMKKQNMIICEDINMRVQKLKFNLVSGIEGSSNRKVSISFLFLLSVCIC